MNFPPNAKSLPDELGQRISAYLDGELSQREAAEVERLLAADPAARRFADDLLQVSAACREARGVSFGRDLTHGVLAEALRRQASGEASFDGEDDRLEPEGYFGLPLGKASRGWSWALVAAAAAVLIGFYGRPGAPSGRTASDAQLAAYLEAMQQAAPGMQVVNYRPTPEQYRRLRQRLAFQSPQQARLPGELMAVSQQGMVVQPSEAPAESGEQLVYVDAEQAELDRLLGELGNSEGGSLVSVAPDAARRAPSLRAVPLHVEATPEALAKLQQQAPANGAVPRRFIVLRIQLRPQP